MSGTSIIPNLSARIAVTGHRTIDAAALDTIRQSIHTGAMARIAVELATEMAHETSGWHNLIHAQTPKL